MKRKIEEIVTDWYMRGFYGSFPSDWGKGVFHYIEDIKEAGDESYSFYIDFGSADIDKALNDLAEELYFYGYKVGNNPESIHDYVLIKKISKDHEKEADITTDPEEHEEKLRHYRAWATLDVTEAIKNNPDVIKELSDYIHTGESKKTCPRCGAYITFHPAISRKDNETEICSDCGVIEAIEEYKKAQGK